MAEDVAKDFPDNLGASALVDSAAMLVTQPAKFDVIVTENLSRYLI